MGTEGLQYEHLYGEAEHSDEIAQRVAAGGKLRKGCKNLMQYPIAAVGRVVHHVRQ